MQIEGIVMAWTRPTDGESDTSPKAFVPTKSRAMPEQRRLTGQERTPHTWAMIAEMTLTRARSSR